MNLTRYLGALLLLLALQFLPGLGVGQAQAACTGTLSARADCGSKAEAYQFVQTLLQPQASVSCVGTWGYGSRIAINDDPPDRVSGYLMCKNSSGSESLGYGKDVFHPTANGGCPAGSTWDDANKVCFSSADCLARNSDLGSLAGEPRPSLTQSRCVAGCEFAMETSGPDYTVADWGGQKLYRGVMAYSGNACTVTETTPEGTEEAQKEMPPQECRTISGQSVCVKPNGDHCYSGPIGRAMQFCWRPGQTGQKASADIAQARGPGSTVPTATPPAGETLTARDAPITTQSTYNGTVVYTTVQNYTTDNGTDAGTVDEGEPSDGSGGTGSDPDDEGEPGGVTGGVDCDSPPVVSGDPLLANIILQTWGTRCAVESQDAVTSTGEIGDCSVPFTVSGPEGDANVLKLKGIRAEICGHYGDADANGQPDWTQGDAPTLPGEGVPDANPPEAPSGLGISTDLLDMDGFLFGSPAAAPTLGVLDFGQFGTFDLDAEPWWSDLVAIMRAVVLMMCAFAAIKILLGGA